MKKKILLSLLTYLVTYISNAQTVVYAEPNHKDKPLANFEVIGQHDGNILVYKNYQRKNTMSVYDADMKEASRLDMDFLPIAETILGIDFIDYPDHMVIVYQYQKKHIVYCMAAMLAPTGKLIGQTVLLDSTDVGKIVYTRWYTMLCSEDKRSIMVFKILESNIEKQYYFKTLLFDNSLQLKHTSRLVLPKIDPKDYLREFALDNAGNLVFGKLTPSFTGWNIYKCYLQEKPAMADSFVNDYVKLDNISLKSMKLKVDNANHRYLLTSFYSKNPNPDVEGIFQSVWDGNTHQEIANIAIPLGNDLRANANGKTSLKTTFNNFYLQHIIPKSNDGFLAVAESIDHSAYSNSGIYRLGMTNPSYYSDVSSTFSNNGIGQANRLSTDNIMIISFDKEGRLLWSNLIYKTQFDDGNGLLGYQLLNTGDELYFIYNDFYKGKTILNYQVISPSGKISQPEVIKGLNENYNLILSSAKQIGQRQAVIPYTYRNYLGFARVDF